MPKPSQDPKLAGLIGDGWPDTDTAQERDFLRQIERVSGRKPGDTFSIIDDCIDLERELNAARRRREQ